MLNLKRKSAPEDLQMPGLINPLGDVDVVPAIFTKTITVYRSEIQRRRLVQRPIAGTS
jgi:hypothetical protein